jgi:parvulin-like peptidyl-prolyl isomerase
MRNLLHRYQQPILIVVTLVVIAGFILFWNGSMMTRGVLGGGEKVATIYGRTISDTDVLRDGHRFQVAAELGLSDLIDPLAGGAQDRQQAFESFLWNSYVFDHEADALQVFPTDAEVQNEELTKVPGLQTDGRLDPAKLTDLVQNRLPSLGFTDAVIDELVRQQVRVKKVMALIGATVDVSPAELQNRYVEATEKMDISVVRLSTSDLEKSVAVSDDDAKKAYDAHKETYQSAERRKVSVGSYELSDAQKDLTGKDRTDALQKLGNDAWTFAQAVVDKNANFAEQAKKYGAQLSTSGFFTADQPDPALSKIPALSTTAFQLSADYPSSDVVEGPNGYYVLHLEGSAPSRQLSFEEAKPQVIAQIQKDRAAQIMQTTANNVRNKILAGLKAGKSFEDASAAAGLPAESIPAFSLMTVSKVDVPDIQSILQSAVSLADGQVSDFVTTDAGGLLVYMKGREPVNKGAAVIGETMMKEQVARQKQEEAFVEWLRLRKEEARLQVFQRGA